MQVRAYACMQLLNLPQISSEPIHGLFLHPVLTAHSVAPTAKAIVHSLRRWPAPRSLSRQSVPTAANARGQISAASISRAVDLGRTS